MKKLSIADIALSILRKEGKMGLACDDVSILRSIFIECKKRKVMLNIERNWKQRVINGLEVSSFKKIFYKGKKLYIIS